MTETATQRPFLVNVDGNIIQAPVLRVAYAAIMRVKRDFGWGREVEKCGIDTSKLDVRAAALMQGDGDERMVAVGCIDGGGRRMQNNRGGAVAATASGIASIARRLRDDDAADLAQFDHEIARLQSLIAEVRTQRRAAVQKAWKCGVRLWVDDVKPVDEPVRVVS